MVDFPRNQNGKVAAVIDMKVNIFDNVGGTGCAASANCISGARLIPR
jgi:hypothetical protein